MGRPPWGTPEQLTFLRSFVPRLDEEKANNGLTQFYAFVTQEFAKQWAPPILDEDLKGTKTLDEAKVSAYNRRGRVSQHI